MTWTGPGGPIEAPRGGTYASGLPDAGRDLLTAYDRYRARQCALLLHTVPRAAIRPLYARARAWAVEQGLYDRREPMDSLLAFVETLLPLPPFEVWRGDRERHPLGHAEDAASDPLASERADDTAVVRRVLDAGSGRWAASLHLVRRGRLWKGYVRFERPPTGPGPRGARGSFPNPSVRTAEIFVEPDPGSVEQRFRECDQDLLRGLLRSALP